MKATGFTITTTKKGITLLSANGELTVATSSEFKHQLSKLLKKEDPQVGLSLEHILSIDVSALQLILALKKELTKRKKKLVISWPQNSNILSLIKKTGLQEVIEEF